MTTVGSGQTSAVSSGSPSGGWIVDSGGTLNVLSGGFISGAIDSGGILDVMAGGTALATTVSSGGTEYVFGLDISGTVSSGGTQVLSGGTASATALLGGNTADAFEYVSSGGLAIGTVASAGDAIISAGGTASGTIVLSTGYQGIYSGGTAIGTVVSGGAEYVFSGGIASSTLVKPIGIQAGEQIVRGGVTVSTVLDGSAFPSVGALQIVDSGTASATIISSGGTQQVDSAGTAISAIVSKGGAQVIGFTPIAGQHPVAMGTVVSSGGTEYVSSGGTASGTTVSIGGVQLVFSAGSAVATTIGAGGQETVSSGGTASGTLIGSGGTEFVSSGGTAVGVAFGGSAATLDIRNPSGLSGTISNWQAGDTIDFVSTSVTSATISGSTLTVTVSGGQTFQYQLSGQQANTSAALLSDGSGGTEVELVQAAVSSGQVLEIFSGQTSSGLTVLDGGVLKVDSGGFAVAMTLSSGGTEYVSGLGNGTTVSSGGTLTVVAGGSASGTTILSSGIEIVSSGTDTGAVLASGGRQIISYNGDAISASISSGSLQELSFAGRADAATISSGGTQFVEFGGTASGTIIDSGGSQVIFSNAGATATIVNSGGTEFVSGGTASGTTVNSSGEQDVDGGLAAGTIVSSGGVEYVNPGGTASGTAVYSGGSAFVSGLDTGATINYGGIEFVYSGGTASGTTVVGGGTLELFGGAVADLSGTTVIDYGATLEIASGYVLSNYPLSNGVTLEVASGGVASGATIIFGGTEMVLSGGSDSGAVVSGAQEVLPGGTASGAVLDPGGRQDVSSGAVVSGTILSGGTQNVLSGAVVAGASVVSGYQNVSSGGTATGTTVGSGGADQLVSAGGTALDTTVDGGEQDVSGTASGTIVDGGFQYVESGGTSIGATISGGYEYVFAGGTASGTTIGAGSYDLVYSGAIAKDIAFGGTSATLELLAGPTGLSGTISGWQIGDTIVFDQTSVTSATISGSTLTIVTSGGQTFQYALSGQEPDTEVTYLNDVNGAARVTLVSGQIDTTPPTLVSITRSDPALTNAGTVHYTVTFSEPVTGVSTSDFSLTITGLTGASIASVTPVDGSNGAQYIVTVNDGAGDGTLALQMTAGNIQDLAGNPLTLPGAPVLGPTYTIDQDTGEQGGLSLNITSPTTTAPSFTTVDFSNQANFTWTGRETDPGGGTGVYFPGGPSGQVTLGGIPFNITSNAAGYQAWNAYTAAGGGNGRVSITIPVGIYGVTAVYTLINTYWELLGPNSDASLIFTGSAGATYTVHLIGGSDIRNWLASGDATINGTSTVNVFTESSNGFNSGTGNLDMQKIVLPSEFATQTLTSIQLVDDGATGVQRTILDGLTVEAAPTTLIGAATAGAVQFTIGGLDPEDTGTATFTDVNGKPVVVNVNGSQTSYTVDLSSLADGPITSTLFVNTDAAGNAFTTVTSHNLTLDTTAPTLTAVTESPSSGDLNATKTVTITITTSERVTVTGTPTLTLNDGGTATYDAAKSTATSLVFDYTVASTDTNVPSLQVTSVNLPNRAKIQDGGGNNAGLSLGGLTQSGPQIDTTLPKLVSITQTDPAVTNANTVHYTVTFSEPVTGVNVSDFSLTTSGLAGASITSVTPVSGSNGAQYTIAVSDGTGDGTLAISLTGGSIRDLAGNSLAGGHLGPATSYPAGAGTDFVTLADVNGDGIPDLIATNNYASTVSVSLGNGDGTFQNPASLAVPGGAGFAAVGDLNGDGKPDIVVAAGGSVVLLQGNGDGTFQPATTIVSGFEPLSVTLSDLNGDGKLDLVVTEYQNSAIAVLMGNGDGTFQTPMTYAAGLNPAEVAVADLNGDDKPDLIVANNGSDVSVLLGNGDGTFQAQKTYASGSGNSVVVGDVNGDGKLDLVVSNIPTNTVSVLLRNGDGTFQAATKYSTEAPYSASLVDINGDGKLDIVANNFDASTVSVLLGNGDGTFQPQVSYPTGSNPYWLAAGDLNGDGRPDIVTGNFGTNNVSVLLNGPGQVSGPTYTIDITTPKLTAVGETPSTGDLNAGKTVTITITTSEPVTVTGTPTLTLNDGGTATYSGISTDGKTLTFSYTAASSDSSVASLQVTSVTLPNGATIRDGGGNNLDLSLSSVPTYSGPQIDTTIPTVTAVAESPSTGDLNATKAVTITITVSEAVTVTGTPTLTLNDGGIATYSGISSDGKTLTFSYTVGSSDSNVPALQVTSVNLTNGATIRDSGGNNLNLSLSAVATYGGPQIDASAPAAPVVSGISPDTGSKSTDGITNATIVTVTGTAEANSTIKLYDGTTLLRTVGASSSGTWSVTNVTLSQGTNNLTATATDAAGNTSAVSATFAATLDTTAPAAPVVGGISPDTGSSSTDGVTDATNVSVSGTAEPNSTVSLYDGKTLVGTVGASSSGTWSVANVTLSQGTNKLTATATDPAGNTSGASAPFVATLDTTAPAAPAVSGISPDTGSSSTDGITDATSVTVTGTAEANSTVKLYDGTTLVGTVTAKNNGAWSVANVTLSQGSNNLTATATDAAGNTSAASAPFMSTLDTTAPVPVMTSETLSSGNVTLSGTTSEGNDTIAVYDGKTLLGSTTTASNGAWSFTISKIKDTVHTYTVKATDIAGNAASSPNEAVLGSSQADNLIGTSGNDIIIGGGGGDTLTGAGGSDVFKYNAVTDSQPGTGKFDTITDFSSADTLDFSGITTHVIYKVQGAVSGPSQVQPNSIAWYLDGQGNTIVIADASSTVAGKVDMQIVLKGFAGTINTSQIIPDSPPSDLASNLGAGNPAAPNLPTGSLLANASPASPGSGLPAGQASQLTSSNTAGAVPSAPDQSSATLTVVSDGQTITWNGTTIGTAFTVPSDSGTATFSDPGFDTTVASLLGDAALAQDVARLVADLGALPADPATGIEAVVKELYADVQAFLSHVATDAGKPDQIRTDVQTFLSNLRHDAGALAGLENAGETDGSISSSGSVNAIAVAGSTGSSTVSANSGPPVPPSSSYDQLLSAMQQFGSSSGSPSGAPSQNLVSIPLASAAVTAGSTDPNLARDMLQLTQLLATELRTPGALLGNTTQAVISDTLQFLTQPHHS
jgi:autotransporter passenger strand-loop-strand repeat protein